MRGPTASTLAGAAGVGPFDTVTNRTRNWGALTWLRAGLGGVRLRASMGALFVALSVFAAFGWALTNTYNDQVHQRLLDEATAAADEIASAAKIGNPIGVVPWQPSAQLTYTTTGIDGDPAGTIIGTSGRAAPTNYTSELDPNAYDVNSRSNDSLSVTRTTTTTASTADGDTAAVNGTVTVWATNPGHVESLDAVIRVGGAAIIVLVPAIVAAVWLIVGHTLAPVEKMRVAAERIGEHGDTHERLPEPLSDDEIGRLARTLNDMLDHLEAGEERQAAFVSDASHELRTPITTLQALITNDNLDPDRKRELLERSANRLQHLVEDLFTLAKLDEYGLECTEDIDIDVVCEEAATAVTPPDGVAVAVHPTPIRAVGNADALERGVINLVANAVRYATSRVEIAATLDGENVTISVDDDGAGVSEEDRHIIFERFRRSDSSRDRHNGGTGLGLAIVAEIVAAHHGTVNCTRSELGGARFTITIPAAHDDEDS